MKQLNDKDLSMLEERIKRSAKSVVRASGLVQPMNVASVAPSRLSPDDRQVHQAPSQPMKSAQQPSASKTLVVNCSFIEEYR